MLVSDITTIITINHLNFKAYFAISKLTELVPTTSINPDDSILYLLLYFFILISYMIISLDNFDEHGRSKPVLNSPRSLEACKRQGIDPDQLVIKTLEEIRHIYKDGMNDKKSLQIKLQHHETRRKNKLEIVRKERGDIINNVRPIYRPNHSTRQLRVQVIEVQNKLEKKRIMDQVKAQLKQKQLQIKEMKIASKINKLEYQKKEAKIKKEFQKVEQQRRAEKNQMKNQILHQTKVNNYLFSEVQKEQKIQENLMNKKLLIEEIKKEKQQYYDQKSRYCKQIENKTLEEKKQKVYSKFNEIDQRLKEKEEREEANRRNIEEYKRKDVVWRQTKQKEVEIEEKKRQSELYEAIMYKDLKKEEYIGEIEGKKERYYGTKKKDREAKSELVKTRLLEDQKAIEKRRRIMELVEEEQRRQEEQRKMNERIEMQGRRQEFISKEKERLERLKEEQEAAELNNQYLLEKKKEKLNQIEEKKKQQLQKEKEKFILKELKQKEADENRRRLEKIQEYEKMEDIAKYNEKMKQIQKERKAQRSIKVFKNIDRSEVQSKIISQQSLDRQKARQNRDHSEERITAIKIQAKKNPIEVKEKMKKQEIAKLIENLKIQCNKEEYAMMKQEQGVEKQREELQKTAESVAQLRRLQKIHGVQRARFQQRLTAVMKLNQQKIARYKQQLLK